MLNIMLPSHPTTSIDIVTNYFAAKVYLKTESNNDLCQLLRIIIFEENGLAIFKAGFSVRLDVEYCLQLKKFNQPHYFRHNSTQHKAALVCFASAQKR